MVARRPCQGETALPALCKGEGLRTHHTVYQCTPLADSSAVEEVSAALTVAPLAPEEGMSSVDAGAATRLATLVCLYPLMEQCKVLYCTVILYFIS